MGPNRVGFLYPHKKGFTGGRGVYGPGALIAKILLVDKEIMSY